VTDAANHTSNSPTFTVAVGPATPVFGNLTVAAGIPQGTATVAFSGSIAAATFIPPGNEVVAITLDGVTQDAAINAQGNFTSTFNTSQLIASFTPYPVTYAYAGDANFRGIANSTTTKLTVNGVEEPVYRIYSPVTTEHLYTADLNEYDTLATRGWTQEGVAFDWYSGPITLDGVDAEPMYRLYNAADQQHLWTSALNEYNTLKAVTGMWSAEGIVGYVFPTAVASSAPLYRLIYPFAADMHLWTTNLNEINTLISQDGWTEEGIAGYVL